MKLTARTLARIETVRVLRHRGMPITDIAARLNVTPRTISRYTALARKHPSRPIPTSWETRAACKNTPVNAFFPTAYQARRDDVKAAKAICRACPVQQECRAWALANPWWTSDGIWGGMTPPERVRARRTNLERKAAAA